MTKQITLTPDREAEGHAWELLGLGVAPFSVHSFVDTGNAAPCKIGKCAACGQALKHNVIIEDGELNLFAVGSDCALALTDDKPLTDKIRAELKAQAGAKAAAQKDEKVLRLIEAFRADHSALYAGIERNKDADEDLLDIWVALQTTGKLTARQYQFAHVRSQQADNRRVLAQHNHHAGEIGEVRTFRGVIDYSGKGFAILNSDDGAQVTFACSGHSDFDAGNRMMVTGTVTAHVTYKGIKQTKIKPTLAELDLAAPVFPAEALNQLPPTTAYAALTAQGYEPSFDAPAGLDIGGTADSRKLIVPAGYFVFGALYVGKTGCGHRVEWDMFEDNSDAGHELSWPNNQSGPRLLALFTANQLTRAGNDYSTNFDEARLIALLPSGRCVELEAKDAQHYSTFCQY